MNTPSILLIWNAILSIFLVAIAYATYARSDRGQSARLSKLENRIADVEDVTAATVESLRKFRNRVNMKLKRDEGKMERDAGVLPDNVQALREDDRQPGESVNDWKKRIRLKYSGARR